MHLATFRVRNYKSYLDSNEIGLTPGFNIIVGENNVGKSALAEALAIRGVHQPHRSRATVPTPGVSPLPDTRIDTQFAFAAGELRDLILDNFTEFLIGADDQWDTGSIGSKLSVMLQEPCTLHVEWVNGAARQVWLPEWMGPKPHARLLSYAVSRVDRQIKNEPEVRNAHTTSSSLLGVAQIVASRIYRFSAERLNVGNYPFGASPELDASARNLPEVLNALQSNPARFARLNAIVRDVLPQVQQVSVRPTGSQGLEIIVWNDDPSQERLDLAIPLAQSGTGIGQVLAILYVALAADVPRTIVIDEPQSFLHPGAARKLLQVLSGFKQHQFIVTTHSPIALTTVRPDRLFLLRKRGAETEVEQLDAGAASSMQETLLEVGARLSDVFGADQVLWVEGRTEELCVPLVAQRLCPEVLTGTVVLGVLNTGDLEGRRAQLSFDVYRRLATAPALIPPVIGFLFDRDGRTDRDIEDMSRQGGNLVRFLPRRMFENYLMLPAAIAAVANDIPGFSEFAIKPETVSDWLAERAKDTAYLGQAAAQDWRDPEWRRVVHGARILADLFRELSEGRVEYDKTHHGVMLTSWILDQEPTAFDELARLLRGIAGRAG